MPLTEARIVALETGDRELPHGEPGELVIRGPQVMKAYWRMPDETRTALRDGWLHTGDVATMDADGYVHVVDRKKDMILAANGLNVYPREVEEVLVSHPSVCMCAVVGVPSPDRGEVVQAFIVAEPGHPLSEEDILSFCRQELSAYKVPRRVMFRDSLPMSAVGKTLRRVLAEEARKTMSAPDSEDDTG
jgi:long-chain acyl-CoA synthetase